MERARGSGPGPANPVGGGAHERTPPTLPEPSLGVYAISVAAELAGSAVPALRLYERRGLLNPERSAGGTRRYSTDDVEAARRINRLLADGLNLAGVALVLQLEAENAALRAELRTLRAGVTDARGTQPPHPTASPRNRSTGA